MAKLWARLRLPVLIAIIAAGSLFMSVPSIRTRGFFAFYRGWQKISPGSEFPGTIVHYFGPFIPIRVQLEPKINMLLDPNDLVTAVIISTGTWEPETLRTLESHTPPGGTFIDIGAHVGWYSLHAANRVGKAGHVIAVEPNPMTLVKLRDNIAANGDGDVITVAPVACADAEGTLTLFEAPHRNTGESSLALANASQEGQIAQSVKVRSRSLDEIVKDSGVTRVDVIKIDVEGAELLVLKRAQGVMARYRPAIVVEVVDGQLKAMGTSEKELMSFMTAQGYTAKRTFERNVEFVPTP